MCFSLSHHHSSGSRKWRLNLCIQYVLLYIGLVDLNLSILIANFLLLTTCWLAICTSNTAFHRLAKRHVCRSKRKSHRLFIVYDFSKIVSCNLFAISSDNKYLNVIEIFVSLFSIWRISSIFVLHICKTFSKI